MMMMMMMWVSDVTGTLQSRDRSMPRGLHSRHHSTIISSEYQTIFLRALHRIVFNATMLFRLRAIYRFISVVDVRRKV